MTGKIHRPKLKEKFFFFFSGAIISVPFPIVVNSLANQYIVALNYHFSALIITAVLAPFLEEFAKAYPLFYRHGETERSLFTLGFLTGLGFGVVEFITYVFVLHTPAISRLPALLFHATNTSIVAHGIAIKKSFRFFILAVGLHFLNNFSALYGSYWLIGAGLAIFVSYALAWHYNRRSIEKAVDNFVSAI